MDLRSGIPDPVIGQCPDGMGEKWRACSLSGSSPVPPASIRSVAAHRPARHYAGVHLSVAEDRVVAATEARGTKLDLTGSSRDATESNPIVKTIGIVAVAAFAVCAFRVPVSRRYLRQSLQSWRGSDRW
jgi:hypothetical protein